MVMTSSFVLLVCNALTRIYSVQCGAAHVVGGRVVVAVEDRHRFIHIKADNNIMLLEGLIFLKRQVVDMDRTVCDVLRNKRRTLSPILLHWEEEVGVGGKKKLSAVRRKKRFSYIVEKEEDLINGASVNNV
jgi:hypothetical protein